MKVQISSKSVKLCIFRQLDTKSPPIRFPNLYQFKGEKEVYYRLPQQPADMSRAKWIYKHAAKEISLNLAYLLLSCVVLLFKPLQHKQSVCMIV